LKQNITIYRGHFSQIYNHKVNYFNLAVYEKPTVTQLVKKLPILWNPHAHCHIYKGLSLDSNLSQMKPVHILSHFFRVIIIPPSSKWTFLFWACLHSILWNLGYSSYFSFTTGMQILGGQWWGIDLCSSVRIWTLTSWNLKLTKLSQTYCSFINCLCAKVMAIYIHTKCYTYHTHH
jgi:hypothetical protein